MPFGTPSKRATCPSLTPTFYARRRANSPLRNPYFIEGVPLKHCGGNLQVSLLRVMLVIEEYS